MNKKYWLRGGVIGLIIGLILLSTLTIVGLSAHDISDAYGNIVENIFKFFTNILLISPLEKEGFSFVVSAVISMIYTTTVGSIIGWIYGRNNKSRVV